MRFPSFWLVKQKKSLVKSSKPLLQAVILAAGKSTRTLPLTLSKPKALLEVAGQSILEHNLDALDGLVKEAVIVIGFEGHQIMQRIGHKRGTINISYVEQIQQLGTAHALRTAETRAKDRFIVLMGDDLYSREDLKKIAAHDLAVLVQKVPDISVFGTVKFKDNIVVEILEKVGFAKEGFANTGCYVLSRQIFSAIKQVKKSARGEFELVDALNALAGTYKLKVEQASSWQPVVYPWSLLHANEILIHKIKGSIKGEVEKGVTLKGEVVIGKGTIVRAGAYIEGPVIIGENCSIGPNCYIRAGTFIGDNCLVGNASEVKNSILMKGTHVGHLSYVGDSVFGENVNLGASTITANLRHDNNPVKSHVKGALVSTQRRKLGAILGDNVHTGIHTTIYPGRKIWPGKNTLPGEIVRKDIE